jgi:alanine dehydrogenase
MIIGIPKEIKQSEGRVSITPSGVASLVLDGNTIFVESNAGLISGYSNESYQQAGAVILSTAIEIYDIAEMIVKVKEPLEQEYKLIKENQLIFTYFHFASSSILTNAMIKSKSVCVAYETIVKPDGSLPLLAPMSEIAGRMSIQEGAKFLELHHGGKGKLIGGVPGVEPAKVMVLGGGMVGTQAAKMAAGLGADVYIFDINLNRLRYLSDTLPANVKTIVSNPFLIKQHAKTADLIIGAVLIPGAKAPRLLNNVDLKNLEKGTVLVDVAIDQGGCFESSYATTHQNPIYEVDGIVHYCVANMPGAVPYTSTLALTNSTLPYIQLLAKMGIEKGFENKELSSGFNIMRGNVVHSSILR